MNKFKNIFKILTVVAGCLMFASFSPSLDGRAVVVEEGVFPQGLFAKTVGYLPGDIISVTNIAGDSTVDILVIGALDPSEGVAIMLSPEAADAIGIDKSSNNIVKITKRSGQEERVYGNAVVSKASAELEDNDEGDFESISAEENSDAFEEPEPESEETEAFEEAEESPEEEAPAPEEEEGAFEEAEEEAFDEEEEMDFGAEEESPEDEELAEEAYEEPEEEAIEEEAIDEEPEEEVAEDTEEEALSEEPLEEEALEEESPEEEAFEDEEPGELEEKEAEPVEENPAEEAEEEPAEEFAEDAPVEEAEESSEEAFEEEKPEALEDEIAAEAFEEDELDELPEETPAEEEFTEDSDTEEYEAIVLVPVDANPPESETDEVEDLVTEELDSLEPVEEVIAAAEPVEEEKPAENQKAEVTSYEKYIVPSLKALESGKYYIQIAVYGSDENILDIIEKYGTNYPITIVPMAGGLRKQILIGPVTMDEYAVVLERFKSYGFKDAFLRKIK